jgi:hypothetical protein
MSGEGVGVCSFCLEPIEKWVFSVAGKISCEDCHDRLYEPKGRA